MNEKNSVIAGMVLLTLSRLKDHRRLAAFAEQVSEHYPPDPDRWESYRRAGGLYASCVEIAANDPLLDEQQRKSVVEHYQKRKREFLKSIPSKSPTEQAPTKKPSTKKPDA